MGPKSTRPSSGVEGVVGPVEDGPDGGEAPEGGFVGGWVGVVG